MNKPLMMLIAFTPIMMLFTSADHYGEAHYEESGTKLICQYHFIVPRADGSVSYFSHNIEGTVEYYTLKNEHKIYLMNFKKMLDLLPNLDRMVNSDNQFVDHQYCKSFTVRAERPEFKHKLGKYYRTGTKENK